MRQFVEPFGTVFLHRHYLVVLHCSIIMEWSILDFFPNPLGQSSFACPTQWFVYVSCSSSPSCWSLFANTTWWFFWLISDLMTLAKRRGGLVELVGEAFLGFFLAASAFMPPKIADGEVIREVMRELNGILLKGHRCQRTTYFCHAILGDNLGKSVSNVFIAVRFQRLSTSRSLIPWGIVVFNIDMMIPVEARCSGGTFNTSYIIHRLFEYR